MQRPQSSSVRFGRFDVFGRLGFGGMGEVFRARAHDHPEGEIALKLLRPDYAANAHFRNMFMSEARVGAFLHHPNIVEFVDVGEVDGMLYLASELVDGVSLDRVIDAGALPAGVAVYVAGELCKALHYAHELVTDAGQPLNIVHRDVSASNTMISLDAEVKLTDFGLAKIEGLSLTLTNEVKGKRAYMAPEQSAGGPMDRRVDVFAVGVLLHEMVVGKRPFKDVLEWTMTERTISGTPFDAVLNRALARNRDERFASVAELASAVSAMVPPAPDAIEQLRARVEKAREALRPLNKFDRLLIDELASENRSMSGDAPSFQSESTAPSLPPPPTVAPRDWSDLEDLTLAREPSGLGSAHSESTIPNRTSRSVSDVLEPRAALRADASQLEKTEQLSRRPKTSWLLLAVVGVTAAVVTIGVETSLRRRATPVEAIVPPPSAPPRPVVVAPPKPVETAVAAPRVTRVPHPPVRVTTHPAPAESGAPGYLMLDTNPWSAVYMSGRKLGTTPLRIPLAAGRHVLSLAAKDGRERRALPVTIVAGKEQRISLP